MITLDWTEDYHHHHPKDYNYHFHNIRRKQLKERRNFQCSSTSIPISNNNYCQ